MDISFVTEILLPRLLAASIQSTVFVGLVWMLCRLLPRLSAATRAALWWLVALQLVVGLSWPSPLALPLVPASVVEAVSAAPASTVAEMQGSTLVAMPAPPPTVSAPASAAWPWVGVVGMAWLLGLAFLIARTLRGYLDTRRLLRASLPCPDRALLLAVRMAAEAHGLRTPPRMRLSVQVQSPQLIGPWRPVLLLPADHQHSMRPDELDMALTHELIHLQRRDLWWGLLPAVARHLFFFHPFAHFAAREYELAREAACDAAVVAGNRHCAGDYGRLLVRLGVAPRPAAGLASASPNFLLLKRRLAMLQNTASTPRSVALFVTLAIAVLGVVPYRIVAAPLAQSEAPAAPRNTQRTSPAEAPPAPPAPPATRVTAPPAPPSAPPAPDAPPVPPAPPAPPAGMRRSSNSSSSYSYSNGGDTAYALLHGDSKVMMGSGTDFEDARRLKGKGDLLWFRKSHAQYVVRDPAMLARFGKTFDEMNRIGKEQGALGQRQGALGAEQRKLGEQMAQLGKLQAQRGREQAQRAATRAAGGNPPPPDAAQVQRAAALEAEQRKLGERMARLGERQAQLGREQSVLGSMQAAASRQAEREAKKLMDEAIAKGRAERVSG